MDERTPRTASASPQDHVIGPIVVVLLIVLTVMAVQRSRAPVDIGDGTRPDQFSTAHAMRDLREIATRPHPLASPDNARVREYLVRRLTELGAQPEIQTATVAQTSRFGPEVFAVVHNVVARVPGTASTGAVMLVAHYDSVPSGPGAGDDGAAVAAILETVRALKAGPPLRNDLIVLFTDGEEIGLLGAKAFTENYPAIRDIKIALNFEMRGDYGPVVMFQTSQPNAWLIRGFTAAPYPRANSLAAAIYRHMPNDTDLTMFMRAGLPGMNFAAVGGLTRYHTRLDNADNLDPNSLAHHGSYALALARRFGAMDLSGAHRGDAIYFTIGATVIRYPNWLAIPLALVAAIFIGMTILSGLRREEFSLRGIAAGSAAYIGAVALAFGTSRLVFAIMARFAAAEMMPSRTTYGGKEFAMASIAAIAAVLWAAYAMLARRMSRGSLAVSALAVLAVANLGIAAMLPGGSFLLTWPLIFAAAAMQIRWTRDSTVDAPLAVVAALIALVPTVMMFAPMIALQSDGTILFMGVAAILAAFAFAVFIPYLGLFTNGRGWPGPLALVALTVALISAGFHASHFDARSPRPDSIYYLLNADTGAAMWASVDSRPDHWSSQFFQHHVRAGSLAVDTGISSASAPQRYDIHELFTRVGMGRTIEGDAPVSAIPAPDLQVLDDSTASGKRVVKMRIESRRHAPIIWIAIGPDVRVLDSSVDGKSPALAPRDGYTAWYWGVPEGGFDLTLALGTSGPVSISVLDQTNELPSLPEMAIRPRPDDTMPTPFMFFDSATLVRKTFVIGASTPTPNT